MNNEPVYKQLGITDERHECDVCGRVQLKATMAFERLDTGETVYMGLQCAESAGLWTLDEQGKLTKFTAQLGRQTAKKMAQKEEISKIIGQIITMSYSESQGGVDWLCDLHIKKALYYKKEALKIKRLKRTLERVVVPFWEKKLAQR